MWKSAQASAAQTTGTVDIQAPNWHSVDQYRRPIAVAHNAYL